MIKRVVDLVAQTLRRRGEVSRRELALIFVINVVLSLSCEDLNHLKIN